MAFINNCFVLDDLYLNITNESIVNLNNECVLMQYVFDIKINIFTTIYNVIHLKLNNIITTYDINLIKFIKTNTDRFEIIYNGEDLIEFTIHDNFYFIHYENGYLLARMKINQCV